MSMQPEIPKESELAELAARLRAARSDEAMTQDDLAEYSGVSVDTIRKYEQGRTEPAVLKLRALAEVLNVTMDWLGGLSDQRRPLRPGVCILDRALLQCLTSDFPPEQVERFLDGTPSPIHVANALPKHYEIVDRAEALAAEQIVSDALQKKYPDLVRQWVKRMILTLRRY